MNDIVRGRGVRRQELTKGRSVDGAAVFAEEVLKEFEGVEILFHALVEELLDKVETGLFVLGCLV